MASGTQTRQSRRACEPCRRKKSKCTGERPICSFCQRLQLPCKYAARGSSSQDSTAKAQKVQKKSTKDRVQVLESQIASLSELLGSRKNGEAQGSGPSQPLRLTTSPDGNPFLTEQADPNEQQTVSFSEAQSYPPKDVLIHFLQVYSQKVHLQPLPLFDLPTLGERLNDAPQYFLYSFLALMLEFTTHEYFRNNHAEASSYYSRSAATTIQRLAAEGKHHVEIVQTLLSDLSKAWMSIGTATRLESIRNLWDSNLIPNNESTEENRCYWSIYIIEAVFFPQMPRAPTHDQTRKYPPSVEPPPPIPLDANDFNAPDFDNAVGSSDDLGINTHAGRMMAVWSQVACHLHEIRRGEVQIPWLPESTYSRLNLALFEYEAQFNQRHLMRSLFPFKRSSDEIKACPEYWNPWLTTHLVLHASLALLNHPFIHLVALRRNKGMSQSRLFLQQVVDQALFHSGWVFWLVGIFEDLNIEIYNPLIGLAVAATSTIPWLYQFVKNAKVAYKASQNLAKGQKLLQRLSKTWPCLSQKLESLQRLQSLIIGKSPEAGAADTTINFPPSMIWELLDPIIHNIRQSTNRSVSTEGLPYVSIHVTTDFLHPLADDEGDQALGHFNWEDSLTYGNDLLQDNYPASLVPFDFNIT
ncbi:uncharacterized protein FFNC_14852 [Fusarium fujikuroi]|nr:uncharacterized protein FFC1_11163 [Fusarium fujikuroi]SCO21377.1 uncharacterized protein FFE2_14900 [Fusarium fujikuroi]SCO53410.1 uncharacterized protein FFNC_14852 [Fusarium fujikuroi]